MTTAQESTTQESTTQESTTPTATELLAMVSQTRSKLLDPMDYPGQWTKRQCAFYDTLRARGDAYVQDLGQTLAVLEASTARLADMQPARERMRAAEARLVERLRADPKSEELKAALTVCRRGGVTEDAGRFRGIPGPLAALLTDTCAHCGHSTLAWAGPLLQLDEEVGEATKQLGHATVRLNNFLLPDVEAWLVLVAETVSV